MAWGKDEDLPVEALAALSQYFDLGTIEQSKWAGGYSNKNYAITTRQGTYLVKFLRNRRVDIQTEWTYLTHLQRHLFPVQSYLLSPRGELVWEGMGERAVVAPWLTGQAAVKSDTICWTMGTHLARLHLLPSAGLAPTSSNLNQEYVPTALEMALHALPADMLQPLVVAYERLQSLHLERLPQSIVHGDPTRHNCLWEEGRLVAFIDWEEVGISASLLDLAVAILSYCYDYQVTPVHLQTTWYRALLAGYASIRPLSPEEEQCLPQMVFYAALTVSLWSLLQFGILYPDAALLQDWLHPVLAQMP